MGGLEVGLDKVREVSCSKTMSMGLISRRLSDRSLTNEPATQPISVTVVVDTRLSLATPEPRTVSTSCIDIPVPEIIRFGSIVPHARVISRRMGRGCAGVVLDRKQSENRSVGTCASSSTQNRAVCDPRRVFMMTFSRPMASERRDSCRARFPSTQRIQEKCPC